MSAGPLPECSGFIILSASVISPSVHGENQSVTVREMLINLLKSPIPRPIPQW